MSRISQFKIGLLAAGFALAVAASAAQAFTLDEAGNTGSDGTAKYTDPDRKFEQPAGGGGSTFQFGGGTVTLGPQRSFDNDYNTAKERMLTPLGRPSDER